MADIPDFDFEVRPDSYKDDFPRVLQVIRPHWKEDKLVFKELPKCVAQGLINTMVRCHSKDDANDVIMIRVINQGVGIILNRTNEVKSIKYLHSLNCAPQILASFKTGFCYQFIHGEVLTHLRLREEPIWRRVAEELAKIHAAQLEDDSGLKKEPKFLELLNTVRLTFPEEMKDPEKNKRLKNDLPDKETLDKETEEVLSHILTFNPDLVLAHNDTRAENIVWNKETGLAKFVDFEVVSYNYRASELANHFQRFGGMEPMDFSLVPDEEFQFKWLRVYLEKHFEVTGRNRSDVTDLEVRKLYVLVRKFHLLLCIMAGLAGPAFENMGIVPENTVDLLGFAIDCMREYYKIKEDIMALEMP